MLAASTISNSSSITHSSTGTVPIIFRAAAPARTPPEIIDRLAKELGAILRRPEIRAKLRQAGFGTTGGGPDALRARIAEELPRWRDVIERAGLKRD